MQQSSRQTIIVILILITVNLAIFLPSLSGDFIWDDRLLITENPQLLSPDFLSRFMISPFGGVLGLDENSRRLDQLSQFYRPMTSLSYWIDFKIWGLNPAGFHLTNILLHMLNCLLLSILLLRLGTKHIPALFGGALFAVFPLHFENVAWISGRTDVLALLFAGLSFWFLLNHMERKKPACLWISALFFLFSLLSKEITVFLPFIYFLIFWSAGRKFWKSAAGIFPFGLVFLGWLALRWNALAGASFQLSGRTIPDFLATLGFYIWRTVFPFRLSYTIDAGRVFGSPWNMLLGSAAVLGCVLCAFWILLKKENRTIPALVCVCLFLLLLPSLLVIFSASTVSFLAWRFLYLPTALLAGFAVYSVWKGGKFKAVAVALGLLLAFAYTAEIYPRNVNFGKTEKDFWLSMKRPGKENFLARYNIALNTLPDNEGKALTLFQGILSERDHYLFERFEQRIHEELASYYTFQERLDEAEKHFNLLLGKGRAQSQHFYLTYASYLALRGEVEEGAEIIQRMLTLFPENHLVLLHAAKFYIVLKDYPSALGILERDFSLFPTEEVRLLLEQVRQTREQ